MNDNLESLSDGELSEAFAVEVDGFTEVRTVYSGFLGRDRTSGIKGEYRQDVPSYAENANAVLGLLPAEKHGGYWVCHGGFMGARVVIYDSSDQILSEGISPTFARSACIALLRAKRKEAKTS